MALVADWMQIGQDVFYRKPELYSMGWGSGLNLDDFLITSAPLGGPIALIRREQLFKSSSSSKPLIFIFSSSGIKISSFKWSSGTIVSVGWSRSEELVFIQEDGAVLYYDMFGTYIHTFNFGHNVKDTLVANGKLFASFQESGVAVLTKANKIFVINNIKDPKARKYSEIPNIQDQKVICWCVLRDERQSNVIVSTGRELLFLNHQDQFPQSLNPDWQSGQEIVVDIALSTNARHIALFSKSGNIWIGSSDFYTKYCEFSTKTTAVMPKQMAWCGTGAISLLWEMTLEVISVNGESTTIYLDSGSHLVQELDSVRIISSTTHDLLHKVPRVVVETLGIGSMSPSALLFEASQGYQEGSTRATDCLGMIKDTIEEAVLQCLQSAQYEFSPSTQKSLLRASLFGKTFKPEIDPETSKNVTTTLRVLNAVRDHRVGLPLTWNQLEWMTTPVLLDRLVLRRLFPLALSIASFLKLPDSQGSSRILAHWACLKVNEPSQKGDEMIAKEINSKLGFTPGISYTDIAEKAEQVGRKALAIKLIEYECRPRKQVPVLLRLNEDKLALKRAVQSDDSDLIYTVLFHLRRKLGLAEFLMVIRNFPLAQSLYIKNCRETDTNQLRDIYNQEDDFHGQALLRIRESYEAKRIDTQLSNLQMATENFKKTKNDFAAQITEDQVKLLRTQIRLDDSFNRNYSNLSLHDTVHNLIKDGHLKEAEKMRSDFKIPEKRFCYLRVFGDAEANHWMELNSFSKTKKLVVGFEVFVDACLKHNNKDEAIKYLPKVKDENKVSYHVKCWLLEEALKIAIEQKNGGGLIEIANACGPQEHQELKAKIQALLSDPTFRI